LIGAALAFLTATGSGAAAQEVSGGDAFLKRVFAVTSFAKGKTAYACFTRKYDAAHLAQHPVQKVSAMKLLMTAEQMPEVEGLSYSFRLGLNLRNRPGGFDSSGDCSRPDVSEVAPDKLHLACNVDCDGGGISVELTNSDKSTLIRLERIALWRDNKPEAEPLSLSGGQDDRVFRLDRASLADCRALVTDRKELAALRHK
jgi:hypothetical protein